ARVEVEADAEHEQDDAHLGELRGELAVGDEAGRVRADDQAGEQVTEDGREPEAVGSVAEDERRAEPRRQGQDQVLASVHARASRGVIFADGRRRENPTLSGCGKAPHREGYAPSRLPIRAASDQRTMSSGSGLV